MPERPAPGWVDPDAGHLAVALATRSFAPVFPCLPSKRPASKNGFKDACVDVDRINRWWSRHPDHLVAVPTAGLVVVDLDESDDLEPGGTWAWWHETAGRHGWTPDTCPLVATPRGGLHVYFEAPEGAEIRNSAGKLARGVDVRGEGGYVIAAGSTLPDGRAYELLAAGPWELPEAPPWLVDLIDNATRPPTVPGPRPHVPDDRCGTAYGLKALEGELGRLATAANGCRNDRLNRAAYALGRLVGGGQLDPEHAADQLETVALRTGLPLVEVQGTIRSGMTAGARDPRRPKP